MWLSFSSSFSDIEAGAIHLPMNEIDDGQIIGDINATVMSGCQVQTGIVGNSVYFDGVSAWADLGNQRHR